MSEFSKFDINIQCEEMFINEPTDADLQEYADWLDSQEAGEPQLDADNWNAFDGHLDFYADVEEAYDESDLYGAEYENFAVREWD